MTRFVCLLLLLLLPCRAPADHVVPSFPGDLLSAVPASADSLFLLHFERLRAFPFHDVFDKPLSFVKAEQKLTPLKFAPEFKSCAFFFTSGEPGMLLQSSLSPEILHEISKSKVLQDGFHSAESFKIGNVSCVRFRSRDFLPREFHSDSAAAFLPRQIALFADEPFLRKVLDDTPGATPALRSVMNKLSPGYAAAGVMSSAHFAGLDPRVRGEAGQIAFSLARREGMPSPVVAEVLVFPRDPETLNSLFRSVKEYFETAYRNAAKQGPISPEMRHAFTVSLSFGYVRIDAALTDENAKDFLSLLIDILRAPDRE